MVLQQGGQLGSYEIVSPLGTGAMSEVYRAKDTQLGRDVAIKVLPDAFSKEPDRLERFQREAQLLASLNHPNIASIYGIEKWGDVRFLVLELIPGLTLAEKISSGPLPLREALEIFRQVSEALEAAHGKGIIHRDLKPANMKITPDGRVKLLDFGLAKSQATLSHGDVARETATYNGISEGLILGTPAYMSPEQARGRTLDKRTDIWAFGCCLYEALSGQHPFDKATSSDTIVAILSNDPDWPPLDRNTPPSIQRLVRRCLQKDLDRRLHDIADARIELVDALDASPDESVAEVGGPLKKRALPWVLAGIMAIAALTTALWSARQDARVGDSRLMRFMVTLPATAPMSLGSGSSIAISPDGMRVAYVASQGGKSEIYLRTMDQLRARPIAGTDNGSSPFFSWDGRSLGFFSEGKLRTISTMGGAIQTLDDSPNPRGASWGRDGRIIFSPLTIGGLRTVTADGGTSLPLTDPSPERNDKSHRWPQVLPDGKWVMYTVWTGDSFRIEAMSPDTQERRILIDDGFFARFAPSGHLLFARNETLMAVPFDDRKLEPLGPQVTVLESIETDTKSGAAFYSFSDNGTLVFVSGESGSVAPEGTATLLRVDRQGNAYPLTEARRGVNLPRLSPDGNRLLVTIQEPEKSSDVWVFDRGRDTMTRISFQGFSGSAIWSPDGTRVTFASNRGESFDLYWKPADGSGEAEPLLTRPEPQFPSSWSPDGRFLAYVELDSTSLFDIWILPMEGDREPRPFADTEYNEGGAVFSPGGNWLAYVSNESGQDEVYVRAFPGPGGKMQISGGGGNEPVWASNGRELFYRNQDLMMVVNITSEEPFQASRPQPLFEASYDDAGVASRGYDITPDGQSFIVVRSERDSVATQVHVTLNWFAELKRRAPVP